MSRRKVERADSRPVWVAFVVWLVAVAAIEAALILWRDPAFGFMSPKPVDVAGVLLNLLPVLLAALVAAAVTGRPLVSSWVVLLLLWAIYTANALKLQDLDTPLMPGDALLLTNLGGGGMLLARYIPNDTRHVVEGLVAVAIFALLLYAERRPWIPRRLRAPLALIALVLAGSLLAGTPPWASMYAGDGEFRAWTPKAHAKKTGLFAHLLRYRWETSGDLPAPDVDAATRLLAQHHEPPAPTGTGAGDLPDIVILQSESFFDPARLRGLEPAQVLPNYRALASVSRHGNLWVPTFGGGTIRTEFEVLTGIAMRYFPETQYPYFRLTAMPVQSLASVLAARGYRTIAIHPHDRAFWNRAAAFANLGFSAFDAEEQFAHASRQGFYTSDAALVDHVLERLNASPSPTFVFAISMENHGPYDHYPNVDAARRDAEPVPGNITGAARRMLQGYLYHAENADRALGRLADGLRARSRRTLLLFYGDHLPGLPDVYGETGFDDGAAPPEQPVPWLLFDTAATTNERFDTASFYLPAIVLEAAGASDRYFAVLDQLRDADHVSRDWTPPDDAGLAALMQLRQRGDFSSLADGIEASSAHDQRLATPQ